MKRKLIGALVGAAVMSLAAGQALAQKAGAKVSGDMVKIGVLTDMSGVYSDLMIGVLLPESPDDVSGEISERQLQIATLVGMALVELRLTDKAEGLPHYEALIRRTRRWLLRIVEQGRLSPRERSEAGDALARLGDPRFDAEFLYLPRQYQGKPEQFWGFVEVPADHSLWARAGVIRVC